MEDLAAFIGFLLVTGSLFFLAKFVLEEDEFRYVRNTCPFFALSAALLFWGAARLDPTLSAVSKFFVSGALTLVLILVAQAFQRKKKRPLIALVLALIAASLAIPLLLLLFRLLSAWLSSTFFTPPPTEYQYESRPADPQYNFTPARCPRPSFPQALSSTRISVPAKSAHRQACSRQLPALDHRA